MILGCFWGPDVCFPPPERPNHARDLVATLALEQWDGIVTVSGDGLIYEVRNPPKIARVAPKNHPRVTPKLPQKHLKNGTPKWPRKSPRSHPKTQHKVTPKPPKSDPKPHPRPPHSDPKNGTPELTLK